MRPTLIALHGYTMNGARLRSLGQALFRDLEEHVNLLFPDAPHVCTPAAAQISFARWGIEPPEPPHLCWWRASEDGTVYDGWETTRDSLRSLIPEDAPVGMLGFSQGAMLAATLAALSARGAFPRIQCALLIAGGVPRARDMRALFAEPVAVPSLHVWGKRDPIAVNSSSQLVECFQEAKRETVSWSGSHTIPQGGKAAATIISFVRRWLGGSDSAPPCG